MITLAPEANIRILRRTLAVLLDDLRAAGVTSYAKFEMLQWRHPELYGRASAAGIAQVDEYEPRGTGTIHFTMEGSGQRWRGAARLDRGVPLRSPAS